MTDIHLREDIAASYDKDNAEDPAALAETVDLLATLAGDGPALEFAIGTGRVGLPLSERGIKVHGIELLEPMLAQLQAKPGAEQIAVTVGDMTTTLVDGQFNLVYLVYNTIMNLLTQAAQVACFENAARHLKPGGCFVVEVMVPRLQSLPPGERFQPFSVDEAHLGMDEYVSFTDQLLRSHHYLNRSGRFDHQVGTYRWVWPSELDLMAQLAGLRLESRWAGWDRSPFTDDSPGHVSVWRKPGA